MIKILGAYPRWLLLCFAPTAQRRNDAEGYDIITSSDLSAFE